MSFDLTEYDPMDVAEVCYRAFERLPVGRDYAPLEFSGAVIAYLAGLQPTEDASERTHAMYADAVAVFKHEPEPGGGFAISSMRGAIHSLQYDSFESQWEQMQRRLMPLGGAPGTQGPWTCVYCGRTWEAGTEPDACPDCGAYLMRGRVATEDEREALKGSEASSSADG